MSKSTRPFVWLALLFVACGDSSPDEPAATSSACGPDHTELEFVGSHPDPTQVSRERWCAKDTYDCGGAGALCGTADGRYRRWLGDTLVREGAFANGQPSGAWTDWHPNTDPPQEAMSYGFEDGLADGAFTAWREDGTRLWEHTFAAGRACGTWTGFGPDDTPESTVDHGPCDTTTGLPDTFGLVAPRVTDFGWDGEACPTGTRNVAIEAGVRTLRCLPSGPYRRDRGDADAEVLEVGTLRDGLRDGRSTTFYPAAPSNDGAQRVATTGTFTADRHSGDWSFYRPDGSLDRRGAFDDDLETGPWEGFHPSLLRAWSGHFDDGRKTGVWQTWHDRSTSMGGVLATEETFVDGVRDGPFAHFFPGGPKEREGTYQNGAWSGLVTTFWESGQTRYATTYRGGMANGPHQAWDEFGRLDAKGEFAFGAQIGPWLGWVDPNPLILFFGGGATRTRVTLSYLDGVAEGPLTQHYSDAETGGPLAGEGTLVHGVDEGDFTLYWPSGSTLVEGVFEGGAAQGPWQSFYESGAEHTTWPFARGLFDGPYLERHENGQPRRQGQYTLDRRVGTWTTHDLTGAVIDTEDCGPDGSTCDCTTAPEGCP